MRRVKAIPGPLSAKRILVLRAAHQAESTVAAIRARGGEAVTFPVIEITDPPDPEGVHRALQHAAQYDWLLFTSANGVDRCWEALERLGVFPSVLADVKLGAIGPKTAERLRARGFEADLVAREYVAEQLAGELLEREGVRRVLLLRALTAREILPELLARAGVQVDVVPVYQTRPVSPSRAGPLLELFENDRIDVVLFTSSSTVSALAGLLGPRTASLLSGVTVAAIGPITADTAVAEGIAVDVAAEEHTIDGTLDALEAYFRSVPGR